jgi:hypothetical protein
MRLGGLVVLGALSWGSTARAEYQQSPQHVAIELKFGPYVPHVDDSSWLKGKTPFSDRFGDPADVKGSLPPRGLLSQVEIDYQFFHKFGVLGVGLESGYFSISAPSFVVVPNTDGVTPAGACSVGSTTGGGRTYSASGRTNLDYYKDCISGDSDKLNIVPIALMLVYRFDVLSKRLHVPIIPYMKVGFAYYVWWFGNSNTFTSQFTPAATADQPAPERRSAAGGSPGVVFHPGISIDLSALDPHAARISDQEIGMNRIAAFIELNAVLVDGFGKNQVLNMSDTSLLAGLSFEF